MVVPFVPLLGAQNVAKTGQVQWAFGQIRPDKLTASLMGACQVKLIASNNCLVPHVCDHNHT